MHGENRPLVGEVSALADAKSGKPTFLLVGDVKNYEQVSAIAGEKKGNLSFFWIAALEGQAEGSLLLVEDGAVSKTLAAGGDVKAFVNENA